MIPGYDIPGGTFGEYGQNVQRAAVPRIGADTAFFSASPPRRVGSVWGHPFPETVQDT